jgi:hypothetical protein
LSAARDAERAAFEFSLPPNHHCSNLTPTFHYSHDRSLVRTASSGNAPLALCDVPVSRLTADESPIDFNLTVQFHERSRLHRLSDAVKHESRRFLCDAKSTTKFIGTDTVLAVCQ